MIYIKRDKDGKICEISQKKKQGYELSIVTNPEGMEFINNKDISNNNELRLLKSDLAFIRVLEDLIDVLIKKNIVTITDFPEPVIKKLLERQSIRNRILGSSGMEFYDDENE